MPFTCAHQHAAPCRHSYIIQNRCSIRTHVSKNNVPYAYTLQCFDADGWAAGRATGLKELSGGVLEWLSVWSEVQTCIWPSGCYWHSLPLASVKSRLVFTGTGSPGQSRKRAIKRVSLSQSEGTRSRAPVVQAS